MKVRTKGAALVHGGVVAAILSLITVGDGRSPQDPRSAPVPRAQASAAAQVASPAPAGAALARGGVATPAIAPAVPSPPPPTLDGLVLEGLRGALTYLALFTLMHLGARRLRIAGRWPYAGLGAVAMLAAVSSLVTAVSWRILEREGRVSELLGLALLIGAVVGFIYNWRAGLEAEGDDPARLARVLATKASNPEADTVTSVRGAVSEDGALVDTDGEEYFAGPLQVRTSAPVAFVAALVSAGFYGLVHVAFGVADEMSLHLQDKVHPLGEAIGLSVQSQLFTLVLMGLFAPLPFAAVVLLGHTILRAMDRSSYAAYLVLGALSPLLLLLVMGPLALVFGLEAVIPLAVAMAVYRNMAGVEPKRVKEDIRVSDRRNLVGADHARRTFGRLVKT